MISDLLKPHEKKALLVLLKRIINADGKVKVKEKLYFDVFINILGVSEKGINYKESTSKLCSKFKSHNAKVVCLIELIGMAWVDNFFQKEEKTFVEEVCKNFNFDKNKITILSKWSKEMIKIQLQFYKFLKFN